MDNKTKTTRRGFDAFFDFDQIIKGPNNETKIYNEYDCGNGLHPSPQRYKEIVQAINILELFTIGSKILMKMEKKWELLIKKELQ